jgi:hypothetical protein
MQNRLYIFNRDNTLIDGENRLINADQITQLIKRIDSWSNNYWAISCSAGNSLDSDPGFIGISRALNNQNYRLKKRPGYVVFNGMKSVCTATVDYSDTYITVTDPMTKKIEDIVERRKMRAKLAINFLMTDESYQLMEVRKILEYNRIIEIHPQAIFIIQLGKSRLYLNAKKFQKHLEDFQNGSYRLFNVFAALNTAKLYIEVTDELKELGIVAIETPEYYQPIQANNIIFVDDNQANCELIRLAGFNAVDADTNISEHHQDAEEHDTYLENLDNVVPVLLPPPPYFKRHKHMKDFVIGSSVGMGIVGALAAVFFLTNLIILPVPMCVVIGLSIVTVLSLVAMSIGHIARALFKGAVNTQPNTGEFVIRGERLGTVFGIQRSLSAAREEIELQQQDGSQNQNEQTHSSENKKSWEVRPRRSSINFQYSSSSSSSSSDNDESSKASLSNSSDDSIELDDQDLSRSSMRVNSLS